MITENIFSLKDVYGGYGPSDVIKGISLDVRRGEFLGIIGPNGSGKSTLLRLMTRALSVRSGSAEFEGRAISSMRLKEFARKAAFVPQDTAINFAFSVREIALMGRIPHLGRLQSESKKDIAIADKALEATDTLHISEKYIDSLSAGERQRVIIARALAQQPQVLFLDEPTSHLDIGHQMMVLDLLKRLNGDSGLTVIIVLHDLNLAGEYCGSIALLEDGRIFTKGSPDEVLTYQNIEKVYKTVVVVNKNPVSSRPNVVPVSGARICPRA